MTTGENRANPRSTGFIDDHIYRKHTDQQSLAPEAAELKRCQSEELSTAHVQALTFVDFDEAANTLTTKRVMADQLFHTLWNSTYIIGRLRGNRLQNPEVIEDRIEELGAWLAKYHASSRQPEGACLQACWLEQALINKIQVIRDETSLSNQLLERIESHFRPILTKLNEPNFLTSQNAFVCRVHGDFVIYNVMIDQNRDLHVADFGDTRMSGNLEDVARMYSSLWAIANTSQYRKRVLGSLPDRFLRGYGLNPNITATPYFKANLAYNFLTHYEGQNYMRTLGLLSWTSDLEMSQISRTGMRWIKQQIET